MNVTCEKCAAVFRVDPAKIPLGGVRAQCSECSNAIVVAAPEFTLASRAPVVESAMPPVIEVDIEPAATAAVPQAPAPAERSIEAMFESDAEAAPDPIAVEEEFEPTGIIAAAVEIPPATQSPAPEPAAPEPRAPEPPTREPAAPEPALPERPSAAAAARAAAPTPTAARPAAPSFARPAAPRATAPTPRFQAPAVPAAPLRPTFASAPTPVNLPAPPIIQPAVTPEAITPVSVPTTRSTGTPTSSRIVNPFLSNDPGTKAKRLARALVSDMVAYLPHKREEGIRDGTLKTLFREEIKKSYEEYVDQVGAQIAESTTYFQEALNDILGGGTKIF